VLAAALTWGRLLEWAVTALGMEQVARRQLVEDEGGNEETDGMASRGHLVDLASE
jgi:hypothetical protein